MKDISFPIQFDSGAPILPYVVAHTPLRQMQIILGASKITHGESKFIEGIGTDKDGMKLEFPLARACVHDQDHLNIYITLPTENKELGTGRLGLNVTLGALIYKGVFKEFVPCYNFMKYYVHRFNKIFDLELSEDGASEFIQMLSDEEERPDILRRMTELRDDLETSFFQIPKAKVTLGDKYRRIFNTKLGNTRFPKFLLCPIDANIIEQLLAFFIVIDENVRSNGKFNIDLFAIIGEGDYSTKIIPCLPKELLRLTESNAKGIAIVNNRRAIKLNYWPLNARSFFSFLKEKQYRMPY